MIDLHTHLLPDWDDGARDIAEVDRMLEVASNEGISKIVLTPHVHRVAKRGNDLRGLKTRMRTFLKQVKSSEIEFFVGAEVYLHPEMIRHIHDFGLTINKSNYVFIEFPADHVPAGMADLVYRMLLDGLIPIISHPERNAELARHPVILYDLVRQGALAQITSQSLTGGFGKPTQKTAAAFLKNGLGHIIASDAHNSTTRPPRLAEAVEIASKIIGEREAEAMVSTVPAAILADEQVPEMREPVWPQKNGKLSFLFR